MDQLRRWLLPVLLMAAWPLGASAGPVEKARNAVDPDCTVGKAAKGAAMKATVGVGNRCDVGETTRDTLGIDDRDRDRDRDDRDGPLKKRRDN